ncbi:MAG: L-histidine N(alpha)-methyltransferase [Pyrinomonadaceae bacterium]|nr:L-histidine N(alpha)-methyltransferase [Pyrinomonadaceae bacterium]
MNQGITKMQSASGTKYGTFAGDIDTGLSADPKFLSSKYFYDDEGSRLFQEIMKLPEYYLTRSELEIFTNSTQEIFETIEGGEREFDLIELGAGDGLKTSVLVSHFIERNAQFRYIPVDISAEALNFLTDKFHLKFPALEINPEQGDYFKTIETLSKRSQRKKVILFLGSNVGNFSEEQALDFFRKLRLVMNDHDFLLIGFDLHKNPKTILNAYDDSQGVTAKFNLNLLKRINRELGADFNIEEFSHYASYHPLERAARSFLISQKNQTVTIDAIGKTFEFKKWEPIYMEVSQKYGIGMIERLAAESGFYVGKNFFDENRFYTNSLWKPAG